MTGLWTKRNYLIEVKEEVYFQVEDFFQTVTIETCKNLFTLKISFPLTSLIMTMEGSSSHCPPSSSLKNSIGKTRICG